MNLHCRVEEAFDNLENAIAYIAYAEPHDGTSKEDMQCYAQLLDDIVGLRDGIKKKSAPAVGATEAEKGNTSIFSVSDKGKNVKPGLLSIRKMSGSETDLEIHIHCISNDERRYIVNCLMDVVMPVVQLYEFLKSSTQEEANI